jgi:hypothetical protein
MTHDVEYVAGRVAEKEAADSPRLVGQGMHDLATKALSRGVRCVDIADLDRGIWHYWSGCVLAYQADLCGWVPRCGEGDYPPKIHDRLQPEHLGIERTAGRWVVGLKIGDHAPDVHMQRMTDLTTSGVAVTLRSSDTGAAGASVAASVNQRSLRQDVINDAAYRDLAGDLTPSRADPTAPSRFNH